MIEGKVADYNIVKAAPAQYLIKEEITKNVGGYVTRFGNRALVSGGNRALAALGDDFFTSLNANGITWQLNCFTGESSESNIFNVIEKARLFNAKMIIGVGGGKSLDTAKIAASELKVPIITVPTIAATCSAVTPLGIIYSEKGIYQRDYYPLRNPNLVLVDTAIIQNAPVKYLHSGILDALAKWYEGNASITGATNADLFDFIALQLAETLYEQMFQKAEEAVQSVKQQKQTESLIDVINLNIYLAGLIQSLGVKAVRNGIAHSIHNGLTVLEESHHLLHGLKVGYGIAVQLVLLQKSQEEVEKVLSFFKRIDFHPTFAALNLPFNVNSIAQVAQKTVADPLMTREPFDRITANMVVNAMKQIEEIV